MKWKIFFFFSKHAKATKLTSQIDQLDKQQDTQMNHEFSIFIEGHTSFMPAANKKLLRKQNPFQNLNLMYHGMNLKS